ncbi:GNAT family N-acetyltransferase [Aestuariivita sp.]|jgi:RimJ/RimL family protein N-acetyltransferase|uniref:GNAT family N-acetyltransferase n=1 Tax=Aestuariivita sp. TaxID=1872407 RepID=UPI0021747F5A|nr:GNAT family N-acetyltransferase [Aestuariivita sp.]MCE8007289.1 GNAT family N-acetyltransferase [Aestuariivita sp.]
MTSPHERAPHTHARPSILEAVPALKTARLALRPPILRDFQVLLDIEDSLADTDLRSDNREEAWSNFMQMSATWVLRGHGWWTVEDSAGACGFVGLGFEPGDREPELGYLLTAPARGKGYATEASLAARGCARDLLHLPSLVSYVSDRNTASQNVARKLGAKRDAEAEAALGSDTTQVWRHWGPEAVR